MTAHMFFSACPFTPHFSNIFLLIILLLFWTLANICSGAKCLLTLEISQISIKLDIEYHRQASGRVCVCKCIEVNEKPEPCSVLLRSTLTAASHAPRGSRLGSVHQISGSDSLQSWPKWNHLVLIRDSGWSSSSESCEALAASWLQFCGTRTKYTNISSVITCQVEQAI